nr:MAG TPA: hypothetical protein [Caudoviricetes sp.]
MSTKVGNKGVCFIQTLGKLIEYTKTILFILKF